MNRTPGQVCDSYRIGREREGGGMDGFQQAKKSRLVSIPTLKVVTAPHATMCERTVRKSKGLRKITGFKPVASTGRAVFQESPLP